MLPTRKNRCFQLGRTDASGVCVSGNCVVCVGKRLSLMKSADLVPDQRLIYLIIGTLLFARQ
jgi:hypothetical protein